MSAFVRVQFQAEQFRIAVLSFANRGTPLAFMSIE